MVPLLVPLLLEDVGLVPLEELSWDRRVVELPVLLAVPVETWEMPRWKELETGYGGTTSSMHMLPWPSFPTDLTTSIAVGIT